MLKPNVKKKQKRLNGIEWIYCTKQFIYIWKHTQTYISQNYVYIQEHTPDILEWVIIVAIRIKGGAQRLDENKYK